MFVQGAVDIVQDSGAGDIVLPRRPLQVSRSCRLLQRTFHIEHPLLTSLQIRSAWDFRAEVEPEIHISGSPGAPGFGTRPFYILSVCADCHTD
jgi:hypothetical protein